MNLLPFVQEIGGGLNAVVIIALAFAYWRERARVEASQEKRLEMIQSATTVVERSISSNEKMASAVTALTDEIRRNIK